MRTTLTLEADVARRLQAAVRRRKVTFKEAVNSALRAGLGMDGTPLPRPRFVVRPHSGGFRPGTDSSKLNQLAAELEDAAVLDRLNRR